MNTIVDNSGQMLIHYYYPLDKLKQEVEMRTSYLGRFRKTEENVHLLDMLAFTKDESDLFTSFLKSGMALIFSKIGKRTKNVNKAYRYEPECTDTEAAYANSVHYTIEWEDQYNQNFIQPVDQHIFDALVWYIIWRWLFLHGKAFADDAAYAKGMFDGALDELAKDSNRLVGAVVNKIPRIF